MRKEIEPAELSSVTKVDTCPSVNLVFSDKAGKVLGMVGGESRGIPIILEQLAGLDDFPVEKNDAGVVLGQDTYTISRAFLNSFAGAFGFMAWERIAELCSSIPEDAILTLVVSY